jgi:four helix bundle protein
MATFKRFEDIEAWQKSRILNQQINLITKYPNFKDDPDLKRQIKRSSGSVMDNIAEGFERGGKKEFIQFLSISKGSAGETRSQLYRSLDQELINKEQFDKLFKLSEEISKMIERLMSYLRNSDLKGQKYKT